MPETSIQSLLPAPCLMMSWGYSGSADAITPGTGFGQFQPVLNQGAGEFKMSHPWRVPLDETSEVLLLGASVHNLFLNNATEGGRGVYTFFYGSAVENAIVGNEASSGGVTSIWVSAVAHENESAVVAYNTLANNRLVQNGGLNLAALDWSPEKGRTSLVIGNRVVRNQIWRPGEYGSPNQYYASWNCCAAPTPGTPGRAGGAKDRRLERAYNVSQTTTRRTRNGVFLGEVAATAHRGRRRGNTLRWNRLTEPRPVTDHGQNTLLDHPDYQYRDGDRSGERGCAGVLACRGDLGYLAIFILRRFPAENKAHRPDNLTLVWPRASACTSGPGMFVCSCAGSRAHVSRDQRSAMLALR